MYIDAEKLIAEIKRLKRSVELNREHYNNIPLSRNELDAYYAQELILNTLSDTITSLQQEQPEVDLENTAHLIAIETLNDTKFMTTTMGYVLSKLQDIFIAGAKWGAEHLTK